MPWSGAGQQQFLDWANVWEAIWQWAETAQTTPCCPPSVPLVSLLLNRFPHSHWMFPKMRSTRSGANTYDITKSALWALGRFWMFLLQFAQNSHRYGHISCMTMPLVNSWYRILWWFSNGRSTVGRWFLMICLLDITIFHCEYQRVVAPPKSSCESVGFLEMPSRAFLRRPGHRVWGTNGPSAAQPQSNFTVGSDLMGSIVTTAQMTLAQ